MELLANISLILGIIGILLFLFSFLYRIATTPGTNPHQFGVDAMLWSIRMLLVSGACMIAFILSV